MKRMKFSKGWSKFYNKNYKKLRNYLKIKRKINSYIVSNLKYESKSYYHKLKF